MAEYSDCNTCLHRLEIQAWLESPEEIERYLAEEAPDASEELRERVRSNFQARTDGFEAGVPPCPGFVARKLLVGLAVDKWILGGQVLVTSEERHCNNPYLKSEAYWRLRRQLSPRGISTPESLDQAKARLADVEADYESYFINKRFASVRRLGRKVAAHLGVDYLFGKDLEHERKLEKARDGLRDLLGTEIQT